MKLAYNPITEAALSSAPNSNDIIFDLKGLNIFAKGIKFKGTDTTYSVFKKHTSSSGGGYNGLVPVPSYTTNNNRYLREDGTWQVPSNQYTYSQLSNTDLNTLKTEGKWYYISGGSNNTNGPDGFNNGAELYVGRNASGYRYQKVITLDGDIWVRIFNSSSWGSWARWYTDANTDSKVLLSATTTSNYRPLILGYLNNTDVSSLANSTTNQVYTTTKIYALPSTGYLWANKLYSGGKEVLTSHLSLSNYVTINTAQTITGAKTFTGNIYVPSGYIYGVNESGGGILFFDGTRTIVGSTGESTTSATHIRSKTGHITVGTSNDVLYNILDSGNSVYGSSTTSLPIYTPLKINGTTKNISLHGHKHTISDITNFSHTHTSNLITALTGYSKATSVASLNTSDSLNTALGKLEYKLGIAYDLVATANDNDGTIENLKEVLDVLQGIKDTDTIQALLGKYLPLTGGTITGNLTVNGIFNAAGEFRITNNKPIHWSNGTYLLRILITDDSSSGTAVFNFLQSPNSGSSWTTLALIYDNGTIHSNGYIKSGSSNSYVLLGGGGHKAVSDFATSSSLGNYVTLTTNLTISGIKTFSTLLKFTVAKGTAPFTVTSDTVVTNLNADKLDGVHLNGIFTGFSANGNATRLVIGGVTKDLTIPYASNSDKLDGYHYTSFPLRIGGNLYTTTTSPTVKLLRFTRANEKGWLVISITDSNNSSSGVHSKYVISWGYDATNTDKSIAIKCLYSSVANASSNLLAVRTSGGTFDLYYKTTDNASKVGYIVEEYSEACTINSYSASIAASPTATTTSSLTTLYANISGSLTGNASTASKLQTARTLWGLSFDGSANVAGIMTNVTGFSCTSNWNDAWSDGTNSHPWYGYDHRHPNTGVYSTTISDHFGLTLKTASGNLSINSSGNVGIGTTSPSLKLHVSGNILSNGFKKSGSSDSYLLLGGGGHKAISDFMLKTDELSTNVTTITKSLNITTSWMDTGINGTDLSTGTYIILLSPNFSGTGSLWSCYFSGVMSWYSGNTNDSETDEILLHRGGHAYHNTLYLRTVQTTSGSGGMKLLIAASSSIGSTQNYTFKFKRII